MIKPGAKQVAPLGQIASFSGATNRLRRWRKVFAVKFTPHSKQ